MPTSDTVGSAPCLIVGRDGVGHWLVREINGPIGDIFISREAALRFARQVGSTLPGATTRPGRRWVTSFDRPMEEKAA